MSNEKSNHGKNRNFIIFNVSELNLVNFDEVLETNAESIRRSLDGTKTFIKWEDKKPNFLNNLKTREGPYTYDQMINILNGPEWTKSFIV